MEYFVGSSDDPFLLLYTISPLSSVCASQLHMAHPLSVSPAPTRTQFKQKSFMCGPFDVRTKAEPCLMLSNVPEGAAGVFTV